MSLLLVLYKSWLKQVLKPCDLHIHLLKDLVGDWKKFLTGFNPQQANWEGTLW